MPFYLEAEMITNIQRTNVDGEAVCTHEEHYGNHVLYVETREGDAGRYRSRITQTARVCEKGGDKSLFEASETQSSGHLLKRGPAFSDLGVAARDRALLWMLDHLPEVREAYDAEEGAKDTERQRLFKMALAEARELGVVGFLTKRKVGFMASDDLASMFQVTTRNFNKWLLGQGLVVRSDGKWHAVEAQFEQGNAGVQVAWNAKGVEMIRSLAHQAGMTRMDSAELLRRLRVQMTWLSEWSILEAAGLIAPEGAKSRS